MPDVSTALRATLAQARPSHNPRGYPPELRRRAGAWIRARTAEGAGLTELARPLGIQRCTARSWAEACDEADPPGAPAFLAIRVEMPLPPEPTASVPV